MVVGDELDDAVVAVVVVVGDELDDAVVAVVVVVAAESLLPCASQSARNLAMILILTSYRC